MSAAVASILALNRCWTLEHEPWHRTNHSMPEKCTEIENTKEPFLTRPACVLHDAVLGATYAFSWITLVETAANIDSSHACSKDARQDNSNVCNWDEFHQAEFLRNTQEFEVQIFRCKVCCVRFGYRCVACACYCKEICLVHNCEVQ